MPLLTSTNTIARRAYSEEFGTNVAANAGGRALRDDRYKLIRFTSGTEEFYNLQADPLELTNLTSIATTEQRQYLDRLRFQLNGYSTNTGAFIASSTWTNNQFSCTLTQSASYALWRCDDVNTGFWSQVTNAITTTNGSTVTLKDATPPAGKAYYSVVK
jgi:hypothetical protein